MAGKAKKKSAKSAEDYELEKRNRVQRRHCREAEAFYKRNKSRLLRDPRYAGKWIAIRDRRIMDVDKSSTALLQRMLARFPDQRFYTELVQKEPYVIDLGWEGFLLFGFPVSEPEKSTTP